MKEQEKLDKQAEEDSQFIGNYVKEPIKQHQEPVYPWAPTARLQKSGQPLVEGKNMIDIDSELMNITRKLSNDPKEKYIPGVQEPLSYRNLKDGFFHQESTLLTNPPMDLRGQTKNRWIPLHLDPRINSIEPFRRNGDDTYLALIDNFKDCKA